MRTGAERIVELWSRARRGARRGFTLIELCIVVAIIGILATIAIPNFEGMRCRAKQTEAVKGLENIYYMEMAYKVQFNTFALLPALKFELVGGSGYTGKYYTFASGPEDATQLETYVYATADGYGTMSGDYWELSIGSASSSTPPANYRASAAPTSGASVGRSVINYVNVCTIDTGDVGDTVE